jgi:RES domain-containing protein
MRLLRVFAANHREKEDARWNLEKVCQAIRLRKSIMWAALTKNWAALTRERMRILCDYQADIDVATNKSRGKPRLLFVAVNEWTVFIKKQRQKQ